MYHGFRLTVVSSLVVSSGRVSGGASARGMAHGRGVSAARCGVSTCTVFLFSKKRPPARKHVMQRRCKMAQKVSKSDVPTALLLLLSQHLTPSTPRHENARMKTHRSRLMSHR
jgi:hypothetical protein